MPVRLALPRQIARRQCHRESQAEGSLVVAQILEILDLDNHGLARRYVRNRGGKQVRALLFDQARFFAGLLRLLVFFAGLLLFADFALDEPLAYVQAHAIDRSTIG